MILRQQRGPRHVRAQPAQTRARFFRDGSDIESAGHGQIAVRIRPHAPVGFLHTVLHDAVGQVQLGARIGEGHGGLCAQQCDVGAPALRFDAGQLEFHRQIVARLRDEGVHAARKRFQNALTFRVVAAVFAVVPGAAVFDQPGQPVVTQKRWAQDLGQLALIRAPVHLHLPEPVLRLYVALRKEQIVQVARVDVRHARRIAQYLHTVLQATQGNPPLDARQ